MLGEEVLTLEDRAMASGTHYLTWNTGDWLSGVYLLRIDVGASVRTRKFMVLMKLEGASNRFWSAQRSRPLSTFAPQGFPRPGGEFLTDRHLRITTHAEVAR